MTDSHRLDEERFVGEDDRVFPTGIQHVQSHRVPPTQQIVKHAPGPFVPYVGGGAGAFHGVPPDDGSYRNDQYAQAEYQATLEHPYVTLPALDTPVPVIIVPPEAGPESFAEWRSTTAMVTQNGSGSGVEILGKDMHRRRMRIRNENTAAADGIRIGSKPGDITATEGYLMPGGSTEEIFTQGCLYAIATTGTPVKVSIFAEYTVNG